MNLCNPLEVKNRVKFVMRDIKDGAVRRQRLLLKEIRQAIIHRREAGPRVEVPLFAQYLLA